jgi:hypothetical protein
VKRKSKRLDPRIEATQDFCEHVTQRACLCRKNRRFKCRSLTPITEQVLRIYVHGFMATFQRDENCFGPERCDELGKLYMEAIKVIHREMIQ